VAILVKSFTWLELFTTCSLVTSAASSRHQVDWTNAAALI
jgi:hypothetical protein